MAKLPKSLIKKYGISKKAWSVFRKRKGKKRTVKLSSKKKRGVRTMARRRRTYRRKKKSSGMLGSLPMKPLGSIAYGFVRENVSDMIANTGIAQSLPSTNYTDEGLMLGAMYLARKLGLSKGIFGSIIRNGETIEWARIGQTLKETGLGVTRGAPNTGLYLYG